MTVREMAMAWLKDHKMDGLFYYDICDCSVDDLMPCGDECVPNCEVGIIKDCEECGNSNINNNGSLECTLCHAFCIKEPEPCTT